MAHLQRSARFLVGACLVFAVACGGGGTGGPNSSDPDVGVQLIVQQTLPTNGQEVLPSLADAGEEQDAGVITVSFSEALDEGTVLDPANALNGLTSDVNILNSAFQRVPGTPSITGARGNILRFLPAGGTLTNGQYTITISRDVKSAFGAPLNGGQWDFRSSFTVGTDTYSPVIRNTFPSVGQKGVSKTSQISIMFNESLNPATVNAGSFTVVDGGTNPPTAIAGTITMSHDDFEITFTPDPQNPMPPNATIVVSVIGGAAGITDAVGNPFEGDPATPGTFQFQFETVKEPPLPNNPRPFYEPTMRPPFDPNIPPNAAIYYGADDRIGVIEEQNYIGNWADLTTWGTGNPVPNSSWPLAKDGTAGRVGEILIDPRFNPNDGHSWFYVTDTRNKELVIFGSRDSRIVHRWTQLPDPTGLAIRPDTKALYVTNLGYDTVSMLPIGEAAPVGTRGVTDAVKELASASRRTDIDVGRGPRGISHSPSGTDSDWLLVCNSVGNSVTCINSATFTVDNEISVPSTPVDVAITAYYVVPPYTIGRFAYVTCAGTGAGDGQMAFLWKSTLSIGILVQPTGHWRLQGLLDGFKSPREVVFVGGGGTGGWIADADADEAVRVDWAFGGSSIPISNPQPLITNRVPVAEYPTGITMEPWVFTFTGGQTLPFVTIVASPAAGEVTFIDAREPSRPTFSIKIPKVHTVSSLMDQ